MLANNDNRAVEDVFDIALDTALDHALRMRQSRRLHCSWHDVTEKVLKALLEVCKCCKGMNCAQ